MRDALPWPSVLRDSQTALWCDSQIGILNVDSRQPPKERDAIDCLGGLALELGPHGVISVSQKSTVRAGTSAKRSVRAELERQAKIARQLRNLAWARLIFEVVQHAAEERMMAAIVWIRFAGEVDGGIAGERVEVGVIVVRVRHGAHDCQPIRESRQLG